jgi:hypothetical protein
MTCDSVKKKRMNEWDEVGPNNLEFIKLGTSSLDRKDIYVRVVGRHYTFYIILVCWRLLMTQTFFILRDLSFYK